ncbi:RAB31, member RAS oncogene family, isoform CRA_a, partial [Mus musculus]
TATKLICHLALQGRQIPPLGPQENGNSGGIKLGNQSLQASRRCC